MYCVVLLKNRQLKGRLSRNAMQNAPMTFVKNECIFGTPVTGILPEMTRQKLGNFMLGFLIFSLRLSVQVKHWSSRLRLVTNVQNNNLSFLPSLSPSKCPMKLTEVLIIQTSNQVAIHFMGHMLLPLRMTLSL